MPLLRRTAPGDGMRTMSNQTTTTDVQAYRAALIALWELEPTPGVETDEFLALNARVVRIEARLSRWLAGWEWQRLGWSRLWRDI